jgi:hypothetical protein
MPHAPTSKLLQRVFLGALLLVTLGRAAAAAPDEAPDEPARARAKALMQQGARQMEDRQYDKAVESFTEAYRLVPSPKVQFNLGIAYLSVARYADALQSLEGFLKEDPEAPEASQATARRHIADLRTKVVALSIKSDRPGAALSLDGRSYGPVMFDQPLTIDPGIHALHAVAGSDTVDQTFTAEPGQAMTVTLTFTAAASAPVVLTPIAAAAPPAALVTTGPVGARAPVYRRPWFWVAVGGAAAVAAAVILTLALSKTEYPAADAQVSQ